MSSSDGIMKVKIKQQETKHTVFYQKPRRGISTSFACLWSSHSTVVVNDFYGINTQRFKSCCLFISLPRLLCDFVQELSRTAVSSLPSLNTTKLAQSHKWWLIVRWLWNCQSHCLFARINKLCCRACTIWWKKKNPIGIIVDNVVICDIIKHKLE